MYAVYAHAHIAFTLGTRAKGAQCERGSTMVGATFGEIP